MKRLADGLVTLGAGRLLKLVAPGDAGLVCFTGFGLFKMFRFLEKEEAFRPLPTNLRREACARHRHNQRMLFQTLH